AAAAGGALQVLADVAESVGGVVGDPARALAEKFAGFLTAPGREEKRQCGTDGKTRGEAGTEDTDVVPLHRLLVAAPHRLRLVPVAGRIHPLVSMAAAARGSTTCRTTGQFAIMGHCSGILL